MNPSADAVSQDILRRVEAGHTTPAALYRAVCRKFTVERSTVKLLVRSLMSQGYLAYSDRHGRTVIEPSFAKPVRVTDHIVLTPPGFDFAAPNGEAVLQIASGAAFGTGRHPSTRTALRAVSHLLKNTPFLLLPKERTALDIGTGTGILAIAALQLGMASAVGVDTDPVARYEAARNAEANGVSDRFNVLEVSVEGLGRTFDLVLANLRFPTLIRLGGHISSLLNTPGAAILSGIKREESEAVIHAYTAHRFVCNWTGAEKGWRSLVFNR